MMADKILITEMSEVWQRGYLEERAKTLPALVMHENPLENIPGDLSDITILSVFINSRVTAAEMKRMPHLRLITTRSTGFDHIDMGEAARRGIAVANVPVYGENTVAEHTFALILSLSRNLRKAYFKTHDNDFTLQGLMGFDLKGKTLGVVGTGHIGMHVIRIARGFGMEVLAFDTRKNTFLAETMDFRYVELEELLGNADIFTLHVPHLPATHHLIHTGNIHKIKQGAILINTSRGGLVETAALVSALDQGILAGAGLDVLEGEQLLLEEKRLLETAESKAGWEILQITLKNRILLGRDNVIYTPHMAFYSREAVMRILDTTVDNIRGFLAGTPENTVKV